MQLRKALFKKKYSRIKYLHFDGPKKENIEAIVWTFARYIFFMDIGVWAAHHQAHYSSRKYNFVLPRCKKGLSSPGLKYTAFNMSLALAYSKVVLCKN